MRITVHVKPGSKKGPLVVPGAAGTLTVYLKERAADNAANLALIQTLAQHYGRPRRDITIESGHASRIKRVEVAGV